MKKVNALVLGLVMLLAFGCGGDEPVPEIEPNPAPIEKRCYFMQDSSSDGGNTNKYYQDATGKVIRIERKNYSQGQFYETLEYDNFGLLRRCNRYSPDSILVSYTNYLIDGNKNILQYNEYSRSTIGGPFTITGKAILSYDSTGAISSRALLPSANATVPTKLYQYAHLPSGVMIENVAGNFNASGFGQLEEIREYRFDNKKNPYAALPHAMSLNIFTDHNIVSVKYFDASYNFLRESILTYQYNTEGYPVKAMYGNGQQQFEAYYTYNCQ